MSDNGLIAVYPAAIGEMGGAYRRGAAALLSDAERAFRAAERALAAAEAVDEALRRFSFETALGYANIEEIASFEPDAMRVRLDCGDICEYARDEGHECLSPSYYGVVDGMIGAYERGANRLRGRGARYRADGAEQALAEFEAFAGDFAQRRFFHALRSEADRIARRRGLSKDVTDLIRIRFTDAGVNFLARRAGMRDCVGLDRARGAAWLAERFPALIDGEAAKGERECERIIRGLFGGGVSRYLGYGHIYSDIKREERFYKAHALDSERFEGMLASGNRNSLVAGLMAASYLDRAKRAYGDYMAGDDAYAMADEIAREGVKHPGQLVSLCKRVLSGRDRIGSLLVDLDANFLYRGLLGLPYEALPFGFSRRESWSAYPRWLQTMCWVVARAGESPVRKAAIQFGLKAVREARWDLSLLAESSAGEQRCAEWMEFLARFWRLLAREDKSGRPWADIRAEAKIVWGGARLYLPSHRIKDECGCESQFLPRSDSWRGMAKAMARSSQRCYIWGLERSRLREERAGGVKSWRPILDGAAASGRAIAREMTDSAALRTLGAELNNCLGGDHYARDCAAGKRAVFAVSAVGEGRPGGCFSLRRREMGYELEDVGARGRGATALNEGAVREIASVVLERLARLYSVAA